MIVTSVATIPLQHVPQVGLRLVYLCPSLQCKRVHWVLSPAATSTRQPIAGTVGSIIGYNTLVFISALGWYWRSAWYTGRYENSRVITSNDYYWPELSMLNYIVSLCLCAVCWWVLWVVKTCRTVQIVPFWRRGSSFSGSRTASALTCWETTSLLRSCITKWHRMVTDTCPAARVNIILIHYCRSVSGNPVITEPLF